MDHPETQILLSFTDGARARTVSWWVHPVHLMRPLSPRGRTQLIWRLTPTVNSTKACSLGTRATLSCVSNMPPGAYRTRRTAKNAWLQSLILLRPTPVQTNCDAKEDARKSSNACVARNSAPSCVSCTAPRQSPCLYKQHMQTGERGVFQVHAAPEFVFCARRCLCTSECSAMWAPK